MSSQKIIVILRIALGFIFLWAFLDKFFGLGFATAAERAWLNGGSPTAGFLQHGTEGPLAQIFQSLSGSAAVDWLFMLGLLGIGLGLIFGIMVRLASWGGLVMMVLIYLSLMPPDNNPVIDEHVIYGLFFLYFISQPPAGWWSRTKLVREYPWLA